ncbi:MAG: rubrerythrin family protein [Deltaproteobacteria bacterium]|nr:rubrerythrin family protein [Deltaproteobacteria bacterium]
MKSVKGTQTEKNLLAAFAGESQARNRYTFFAEKAREEGYEQIAAIFEETADNEREHARRFFSFLPGGDVEIQAAYPAGVVGTTAANLKEAAAGEHMEWSKLYKEAADLAEKEGFKEVAYLFRAVSSVEVEHEKRYLKLLKTLTSGTVFKKGRTVTWKCRNCGYIYKGPSAPKRCPTCTYPQAYFELQAKNY